MKLRKMNKKGKTFLIINTVLIIYIFMLSIGYSLYSQTLKISGSATTYNPDLEITPLKIVENTNIIIGGTIHEIFPIKRYFFNSLDINSEMGETTITDSYDKTSNTYNFIANSAHLFPSDSNNGLFDMGMSIGRTLTRPMYLVFENTTAYPLDDFYIFKDSKNEAPMSSPTNSLMIKMGKATDIGDVLSIISEDESNDNSGWRSLGEEIPYDLCLEDKCNIKTDTINNGEYLVIGFYFFDVKTALWDNWKPMEGGSIFDNIKVPNRDSDGVSLKVWDAKFSENSAVKIRMAFDYQAQVEVLTHVMENSGTYYNEPNLYHHSVSWWYQP